MEKRFLGINLVWNKHYSDILTKENSTEFISVAEELLKDFEEDNRIQYCIFGIERGRKQNSFSFHFQGYIEFKYRVDFLAFKKKHNLSDIQARKGSQEQAIEYVKKQKTKITPQLFEFGTPKIQGRKIKLFNDKDPDIKKGWDYQRILICRRIEEKFYKNFEDIEKDFAYIYRIYNSWCRKQWDEFNSKIDKFNKNDLKIPANLEEQKILLDERLSLKYYSKIEDIKKDFKSLYINHPITCNNLWRNHNKNKEIDIKLAKTIWIYGDSGVGKTYWTTKYLKNQGFKGSQITRKKASNEKRPRLWFELEDEKKEVLWIEEIRENFPDYNDIIQLIDRGTTLEIKGSHIDNNFKLIIFNSLKSPSVIYPKRKEILRRLYRKDESSVIFLTRTLNKEPWFRDKPLIYDVTNFLPETVRKINSLKIPFDYNFFSDPIWMERKLHYVWLKVLKGNLELKKKWKYYYGENVEEKWDFCAQEFFSKKVGNYLQNMKEISKKEYYEKRAEKDFCEKHQELIVSEKETLFCSEEKKKMYDDFYSEREILEAGKECRGKNRKRKLYKNYEDLDLNETEEIFQKNLLSNLLKNLEEFRKYFCFENEMDSFLDENFSIFSEIIEGEWDFYARKFFFDLNGIVCKEEMGTKINNWKLLLEYLYGSKHDIFSANNEEVWNKKIWNNFYKPRDFIVNRKWKED